MAERISKYLQTLKQTSATQMAQENPIVCHVANIINRGGKKRGLLYPFVDRYGILVVVAGGGKSAIEEGVTLDDRGIVGIRSTGDSVYVGLGAVEFISTLYNLSVTEKNDILNNVVDALFLKRELIAAEAREHGREEVAYA